MNTKLLIAALAAAASAAASADAAITAYARQTTWAAAPANLTGSVFTPGTGPIFQNETFADAADSSAASHSGGSGWGAWTATSSVAGGTVIMDHGAIYAATAGSSLVITFAPPSGSSMGVMGVGGDFRFFDQNGARVDGRIWVRLGNGTSVMRSFTAAEPFVGFWSDDASAPITSLRIQPISNLGATTFVGLDALYVATVPAPGSVAVLAAVGMIGSRRRR